jgi:ABC-type siderophore export system fused ATPase/permease subunit
MIDNDIPLLILPEILLAEQTSTDALDLSEWIVSQAKLNNATSNFLTQAHLKNIQQDKVISKLQKDIRAVIIGFASISVLTTFCILVLGDITYRHTNTLESMVDVSLSETKVILK